MNKVLLGVVLGAILGAVDGMTAWFTPEVRAQLAGIVVGSTVKGIIAGVLIGVFARKVHSLALGDCLRAGSRAAARFYHRPVATRVLLPDHAARRHGWAHRGIRHTTIRPGDATATVIEFLDGWEPGKQMGAQKITGVCDNRQQYVTAAALAAAGMRARCAPLRPSRSRSRRRRAPLPWRRCGCSGSPRERPARGRRAGGAGGRGCGSRWPRRRGGVDRPPAARRRRRHRRVAAVPATAGDRGRLARRCRHRAARHGGDGRRRPRLRAARATAAAAVAIAGGPRRGAAAGLGGSGGDRPGELRRLGDGRRACGSSFSPRSTNAACRRSASTSPPISEPGSSGAGRGCRPTSRTALGVRVGSFG